MLKNKMRTLSVALAAALIASGFGVATTASAAEYPSWGDVQAAQRDVTRKTAELTRIDTLIATLDQAVVDARNFAIAQGDLYQAAQDNFDIASFKAEALNAQALAAKAKAEESQRQVGRIAALLARSSGGNDLSATLFFSGNESDDLLSHLGLATVVKEKSGSLYASAMQQRNTAQALTAQADVAKVARQKLAVVAQAALQQASIASEQADAAALEQQQNKTRLEAQRAALVDNAASTEASYEAGVAERARIAAEYLAAHPPSAGGVSLAGWARPAVGHITSSYAPSRVNPVTGVTQPHTGTDIGASCNAPIFAAHAGTVSFTGYSGGYGNLVMINHGDGTSTYYGHIVAGGTLVNRNQDVVAGQQIAKVGTTGNSTGCHLHFETRINGSAQDPVPFMRARGVELAG
jgi:murein DD-endopeptidase MepM/ murein hydrolase activator NlpD